MALSAKSEKCYISSTFFQFIEKFRQQFPVPEVPDPYKNFGRKFRAEEPTTGALPPPAVALYNATPSYKSSVVPYRYVQQRGPADAFLISFTLNCNYFVWFIFFKPHSLWICPNMMANDN